jgi:thioredoxin-related protein
MSATFAEGLASFESGNLYGFMDSSGKIVIKPQFEMTYSFSEGIAAVKKNGKWIYIDKTGKTVINPDGYMPSGSIHHGLAFVRTEDMRYGYIDRSGNFVWKPTFLYANTQ